MNVTREQLLQAIFQEALLRALDAQSDEAGAVDEDTQDAVDRIAALAQGPALSELLAEVNGGAGLSFLGEF